MKKFLYGKSIEMADWQNQKEFAKASFDMNKEYFKTGEHKKYPSYFKLKEAFEYIYREDGQKTFKVLEAGCGVGFQTKYLFDEHIGDYFDYTGSDISEHMIEYAEKNIPNGKFIVDDIIDTKIDGNFDVVYESALLELVFDWQKGFEAMLKLSSRWVILHRLFYNTGYKSYIKQTTTYNNVPDGRIFISMADIANVSRNYGFEVIKNDGWNLLSPTEGLSTCILKKEE